MSSAHEHIHQRLIEIQHQLLEHKRLEKLRDSIESQVQEAKSEYHLLQSRKETILRRIEAHAALTHKDGGWSTRNETLQSSYRQAVLRIGQLKSQIVYYTARQAEFAARNSRPTNTIALEMAYARLRQRQIKLLRDSQLVNSQQLEESIESIAAVRAHIVELDEALTLLHKITEKLDGLSDEARAARQEAFLNGSNQGHLAIQNKLHQIRIQLHRLQRELWDTGLEFTTVPKVPDLASWLGLTYQPILEVATLPRRIAKLTDQIHAKGDAISKELANSFALLDQLEEQQHNEIDRLWRPSIVRQISPLDSAPPTPAPMPTPAPPPEIEPILQIRLEDLV
ncbi:MAG: hypothetical protein ACPG8W_05020 [Candidatus Promineifilaceae bacterium]